MADEPTSAEQYSAARRAKPDLTRGTAADTHRFHMAWPITGEELAYVLGYWQNQFGTKGTSTDEARRVVDAGLREFRCGDPAPVSIAPDLGLAKKP